MALGWKGQSRLLRRSLDDGHQSFRIDLNRLVKDVIASPPFNHPAAFG
jgi:hypothetical protein